MKNDLQSQLDMIRDKLKSARRPKKPKMLVVDDEPDNLDLLYRTFRRDFNVLRADSGASALEILSSEGEVAVIISDQRMPEMKGTEFLSKTVPEFPDTVRIILTGFTDVEDLVEAINSGQVYKYITKPWDPDELKGVVQRAADSYDTLKQRAEELGLAQAQTQLLTAIFTAAQSTDDSDECLMAIARSFADAFSADTCAIARVSDGAVTGCCGTHSTNEWLAGDPLAQAAIADGTLQACANVKNDADLSARDPYQSGEVQAHLVVPSMQRDRVAALVSLQWKEPHTIGEGEVTHAYLAGQQVALALATFDA